MLDNLAAEREKLEHTIALIESQRAMLGDEVVETSLAALREKLAALGEARQADLRKLVTVLIVDVVGSTNMIRDLDPEEGLRILDTALGKLAQPARAYGGLVSRFMGDGFIAVFGLPNARENDAEMAVRAGLAIVEAGRNYAQLLREQQEIARFQVRVGISTGWVAAGGVTEADQTVMGPTVNLADRLQRAAEPDSVLIGQSTYQHVRGIFDLKPQEPVEAKGFESPAQVYQITGAKPRSFRTRRRGVEGVDTHMIGREAEMAALQAAQRQVLDGRTCRVVTIVGEAGLGKSRLLYEFENWVDLQPEDVQLFRGRARFETRQLPYALLRDLFAFRFTIQESEPATAVRDKVVAGMQQTLGQDESTEMKAHFVGQLLGYDFRDSPHLQAAKGDPQQLRDRALAYLGDYFRAAAAQMPVLILVEDLHWADDSSLDAISRLVAALETEPVIFCAAARPEFFQRRPNWFDGREFGQRLALQPLNKEDSRRLVNEVLQKVEEIPDALRELIVGSAEGNPFYVEELVKMLIEDGVVVKAEPHWRIQPDRLLGVRVPPTLTGVLQARLDGLPAEERTILQQASVVGRVFWDSAVAYLNHREGQAANGQNIEDGLLALRRREMIFRRDESTFAGSGEHIFKHAVLREVTYESVLLRLRRVYHTLAAEWLMQQSGERAGEVAGLIADHLERAGNQSEALVYLLRAGEDAAMNHANSEALGYFGRAMRLAPAQDLATRYRLLLAREAVLALVGNQEARQRDLAALQQVADQLGRPEQRAEAALRRAIYLETVGDYPGTIEAAKQAIGLAESAGDIEQAARGYLRWAAALKMQGQHEEARSCGYSALAAARQLGDGLLEAKCLLLLGSSVWEQGEAASGRAFLEQALAISRDLRDRYNEGYALSRLGFYLQNENRFAEAQQFHEQALAISREVGDRDTEARTYGNLAYNLASQGDLVTAWDYGDQFLHICREIGNRTQEAAALDLKGVLATWQGRYVDAQGYLDQAMAIFQELGAQGRIASTTGDMSWLALIQGNIETAHDRFKAWRALSQQIGSADSQGWALHGLGRTAVFAGQPDKALAYLREALAIARDLDERLMEAQTLAAVGSAYLAQDKAAEAETDLRAALSLALEADFPLPAVRARLGLAQLALAAGNPAAAVNHLSPVLAYLEQTGFLLDEAELSAYWVCYQVLTAAGDARAVQVLEVARQLLHERADGLAGEQSRRRYLEGIPAHRQISAALQDR